MLSFILPLISLLKFAQWGDPTSDSDQHLLDKFSNTAGSALFYGLLAFVLGVALCGWTRFKELGLTTSIRMACVVGAVVATVFIG